MRIRIVPIACVLTLALGAGLPLLQLPSAHATTPMRQSDNMQEPANLPPDVAALIKQSTAVYQAMKSYRHVAECLERGKDLNGAEINHSSSYVLALERPNKFCYKSEEARGNAAVSDGKTFVNYRPDMTDEQRGHTYFTRIPAPANYKGINIVDDVTFQLGSYMIALMLQGNVYADKEISKSLMNATLKPGVMENGKKYDVLVAPFQGSSIQFFFDANTHLLRKTYNIDTEITPARRSEVQITEIMEEIQIDKPIPLSVFQYMPPKGSHLIVKGAAHNPTNVRIAFVTNK